MSLNKFNFKKTITKILFFESSLNSLSLHGFQTLTLISFESTYDPDVTSPFYI